MNLEFSSTAPSASKPALEELLFFNPRQHLVSDGIVDSVARFGQPRLVEAKNRLFVCVGETEAQALFAFDLHRRAKDPVGVVIFIRASPSTLVIVHVAVHADYAVQGTAAAGGLGIILVEKVREIANRIVGIAEIVLFYRRELVIRINRRDPSAIK